MTTMKANPGGQLKPPQIVGRDRLAERLWRVLDRQSLVLSAERRVGKTSLMKKMISMASSSHRPMIFSDLEKHQTRLEFVEGLLRDVKDHLGALQRTIHQTRKIVGELGDIEVKSLKIPTPEAPGWKIRLIQVVDDLMKGRALSISGGGG